MIHRIETKRSILELNESLAKVLLAYVDLVEKHERYTQHIEDDKEFDTEEAWLGECQQNALMLEARAKDYETSTQATAIVSEKEKESSAHETPQVIVSSKENENNNAKVNDNDPSSLVNNPEADKNVKKNNTESDVCAFKIEKPKMPKYDGNVREYAIFKADFKHIIGSKFNDRDAITLLRSALTGKPLDFIKAIGSDYQAAWDYLDSIYGDPRFVADTVTSDLTKFKPLRNDEDSRFCELIHLVRKSYNTLKEVGRPYDMDNNHMIAIIEQRMCSDDRKIWARHLEREKT